MVEPIYDENLIVGIKNENRLDWYIANKLLWIMDLQLLSDEELEGYFSDEELKNIRKDLITISNVNVLFFLKKIEKYKVETNAITLKILETLSKKDANYEELDDFYPSILIDFDNNTLYSQFTESFAYENYVPRNWIGKYDSFIEIIQDEDKYWIYRDKKLLGF